MLFHTLQNSLFFSLQKSLIFFTYTIQGRKQPLLFFMVDKCEEENCLTFLLTSSKHMMFLHSMEYCQSYVYVFIMSSTLGFQILHHLDISRHGLCNFHVAYPFPFVFKRTVSSLELLLLPPLMSQFCNTVFVESLSKYFFHSISQRRLFSLAKHQYTSCHYKMIHLQSLL